MSICSAHVALESEVRRFMENVGNVKEESITDFLVWKWRELDTRFNYLRVHPFSHEQENATTGADFDIELWLVGRRHHVALAVQAKKFIKRCDSYIRKLRYPDGTKKQMTTLLEYASSTNRRPFYFIYSLPDSNPNVICRSKSNALGAVFTADARRLEEFADGKHGRRITRDQMLAVTNPFYCMFCCPLSLNGEYFDHYFGKPNGQPPDKGDERLPGYVRKLLNRSDYVEGLEEIGPPSEFRLIGVYDMREYA